MKICLIRAGVAISESDDATVFSSTVTAIGRTLIAGGAEVHIYTDFHEDAYRSSDFIWHNIAEDADTSNLDALVMVNGFPQVDESKILGIPVSVRSPLSSQQRTYDILNNFKGPVFYALSDPLSVLASHDSFGMRVQRSDVIVLSQSRNLVYLKGRWGRMCDTKARFVQFGFEKFPMMYDRVPLNTSPSSDLSYGGQARNGKRMPRLFEWYYNAPSDIDVVLYGTVGDLDLSKHGYNVQRSPRSEPGVPAKSVPRKMNESISHLVTCEIEYEALQLIPQRLYEGVTGRTFVFVDERLDRSRSLFNERVREFAYVKSRDQLYDRVRALRADSQFRFDMITAQEASVQFDVCAYGESLLNTMRSA
jgi:hypothetical protein